MHSTRIICRRRRRGVSTIMGTLIFVGILFTSIIPMYIVMKQADNIYTKNVHEMAISDQDRAQESVEAYAYPVSLTSNQIRVKVINTGAVPVKIVRVWINNVSYPVSSNLASQDSKVLPDFTVTRVNGMNYYSSVTTDRGNSFASNYGTLSYTSDQWVTPSLGIHVLVLNLVGKFKVYVYSSTWNNNLTNTTYVTQGTDFGDIQCSQFVEIPDTYYVKVMKKVGGNWVAISDPVPVSIVWPGASPVMNVILDGR